MWKAFAVAGIVATSAWAGVADAEVPAAAVPAPKTVQAAAPSAVDAALAARKAGRYAEAAAGLQAWLGGHPGDARALHELGVLYAIHGQLPEAETQFELALKAAPDQQETQRALAVVRKARDAAARAGAPASLDVAEVEGSALFAEHRYKEAAVWFAAALEQGPTADRAYRLALAWLGAGDALAARGCLERALQIQPDHLPSRSAWPTVVKALRLEGTGGVDVAFSPTGPSPVPAIADALNDGQLVLARQLVQAAQQGPWKGLVVTLLAAEVALREGQYIKAIAGYKEALALRPGYPPAQKGLADVAVQQGRWTDARDLAGLPKPAAGDDLQAQLKRFVQRRRAELANQLRMAVDPGIKPLPALADQVAELVPPPPPPPVAPPTVAQEPPPEKAPPRRAHATKAHAKPTRGHKKK